MNRALYNPALSDGFRIGGGFGAGMIAFLVIGGVVVLWLLDHAIGDQSVEARWRRTHR